MYNQLCLISRVSWLTVRQMMLLWLVAGSRGCSSRTGQLNLPHRILFSIHYMDLPIVWYIQMKVFIGIRPLRSAENDRLLS